MFDPPGTRAVNIEADSSTRGLHTLWKKQIKTAAPREIVPEPCFGPRTKIVVGQPFPNSEDNISSLRSNLSCNLTWVIKKLYHSQGTLRLAIKGPLLFMHRHEIQILFNTRIIQALCSSFITHIFIQYQSVGHRTIISTEGSESDKLLCVRCLRN
jgi:hypothetical protein